MAQVKVALQEGRYRDTSHALTRKKDRKINLPDIRYVLLNGFHEERKDTYREEFECWNYAIRGKTIIGREIRVIVSFNQYGMMIITAMVICKEKK